MKSDARWAGGVYLLVILFGVYAEVVVRGSLPLDGNTAAWSDALRASEFSLRIALVADLAGQVCYLLLAWILYRVLKGAGASLALLFLLLATVAVAILGANMLNHLAALLLAEGAFPPGSLAGAQSESLAALFLRFHKEGYFLAQIFFGAWLLPLAVLMRRGSAFPGILAWSVGLSGAAHITGFLFHFLAPAAPSVLVGVCDGVAALGEFSLCLWLLIRGVRLRAPSPSLSPGPAVAPAVSGCG